MCRPRALIPIVVDPHLTLVENGALDRVFSLCDGRSHDCLSVLFVSGDPPSERRSIRDAFLQPGVRPCHDGSGHIDHPVPRRGFGGAAWFYIKEKRKLGPVSLTELQQLLASGQLRASDMVLPQSETKWITVEHVPGLELAVRTSADPAETLLMAVPVDEVGPVPVPAEVTFPLEVPADLAAEQPRPAAKMHPRVPRWLWIGGAAVLFAASASAWSVFSSAMPRRLS
jgi:hypothetical protein